MRKAADEQDKLGQAEVDLPAREMLGDMLMELKRPKEALVEYKVALMLSPNRLNGLYGAGRAAETLGMKKEAGGVLRGDAEEYGRWSAFFADLAGARKGVYGREGRRCKLDCGNLRGRLLHQAPMCRRMVFRVIAVSGSGLAGYATGPNEFCKRLLHRRSCRQARPVSMLARSWWSSPRRIRFRVAGVATRILHGGITVGSIRRWDELLRDHREERQRQLLSHLRLVAGRKCVEDA